MDDNVTPLVQKTNPLCYFCEEEIEFTITSKELLSVLEPETRKLLSKPKWRHVDTGMVACSTLATPSNFSVDVEVKP